jgi:hypothetical protein
VTQRLAWLGLRLQLRVRIAFLFVQACTCKDCARQDLKPMQQCLQSTVKLTDVYWSCKLVIVSVFVWPVEPAACTSHGFAIAFCVASRARRVHVLRICNCVLRGESSAHLLCGFDDKQMMSNLCSQGSHVLFVCPLSSHRIPPNSLFSRLHIFVSLFSLLVWSLWKVETMAQSDESDQPTRVVVSSGSWTLDTSDTPPFESVDPFTTCVRARCWGNSGTSQPKAGDSFPGRCDAPSTSSWSDFESSCRVFHQHHHPIEDQEGGHQRQAQALESAKDMVVMIAEELTSQTHHHLKLFQTANTQTMSKPARSESHDHDWKDCEWQETTPSSGTMDLGPEVLDHPAWTTPTFLGPDLGLPAGFQESRATVSEPERQQHRMCGVTQLLPGWLGRLGDSEDSECQVAQTQVAQAGQADGANVNADADHILEATKAQILSHSSDVPSSSSNAWTGISIATAMIRNFTDASSWRFEASVKMGMQ